MEQSFNKVIDLLYTAKQNGVEFILNGEKLQLKIAENKTIDKTLLEEIRKCKSEIVDFLGNENLKSKKVTSSQNKIAAFDREKITRIPLSFSQERLWFIDKLEGSVQYHALMVMRIKGQLDEEGLSYALKAIIGRHEVLRTVIVEEGVMRFQSVMDGEEWKLSVEDGSEYKEDPERLRRRIEEFKNKPFDLSKDYMLRASLINLDSLEYILAITLHHIASDGWSIPIIVQEVVELYRSYCEGRMPDLPSLQLQYSDYAVWQRNYLQGEILDRKLSYWKQKLQGVPVLQLPADFARPAVKSTQGASAGITIDKNLSRAINELSLRYSSSLYMTLLAAFKVLLSRYSGQEDICVGASIANRNQQEVEGLVGFFVNTLAFRDAVNSNITFVELLERVKKTTMEAYDNVEVPFEKVVEVVLNERDSSRTPVFQAMLVLRNTPETPAVKIGELELYNEPFENTTSKFDITFFVTENSRGLHVTVEYSTELFREATIVRMLSHFRQLLSSIVSNPDEKVGYLSMLSAQEQLQFSLTNSSATYPKDKTVVSLFEGQAAKTPDAAAIVFEGKELTYSQLNRQANQLAHYLRKRGVKEGSLVPLCVERSAGMLTAMLGILKAGAAYVPIDTDFPGDRVSYMLEDTSASIVVSSSASRSKLQGASVDIIEIDSEVLQQHPGDNPQTGLEAHHPAYVIYTSGSTGNPKGVLIGHNSLVDYVYGLNEEIQISQCSSYALVSTIATDLGNTVVYSSLLLGGALHIFSKESVSNIEFIHDYFEKHKIDCLKIVPSHWKALSNEGELLLPKKLLMFGGEALQAAVVEDIKATGSGCRIVNHYGPTETTIGKLLHPVDRNRTYNNTVPIGKPFSNTSVYILSQELQLCPTGVPGQLYIAGDGVAQGYLNNDGLTAAKFIKNPFAANGKEVMYGTGDLVKYNGGGEIEFIGRTDDQVKIRGYRVELGEIESILQQCELVREAVVLAKEDKQGNKRLIGYIVAEGYFEREEILSYLREKLPEYMVPSVLTELESLPLTANGKVDRKALPDPEAGEQSADKYIAPRNEVEAKLAEIWQDVLEVDQVGINDDFFELGGHSLLAVRLISAIRKAFEAEMPISDVFDYPTVALLAAQLAEHSSAVVLPPVRAVHPRPERIPLSFSQERLWFIDKLEGSIHYHVPAVLRLQGKLNREALEFALKTIVNRHEVLRTIFIEQEGQASQQIKEQDSWQLKVTEGWQYKEDKKGLQAYIQQQISQPFDLSKDDMLRGELIRVSDDEHMLVVTFHHIASDGWSRSILVKEVVELYAAFEEDRPVKLEPLPVQYADYSLWQRNYLQGEVLDSKLQYWKDKLQDVEPLQLPTDYARPAILSTRGAGARFKIDREPLETLQQLSRQQGTTLFMTLLAVFKVLLYRYSGQKDICVGTPIAGRQQQELEGLIGFFLNTLALRTAIDSQESFAELLQQVKNTTMAAFEHQEVPFEKVVDSVVKERDMSRTPLFQVMFVLQNTPEAEHLKLGKLALSAQGSAHQTAKFEIILSVTETTGGLSGLFEYNTDLYNSDTIERMISHFKELITSVAAMPQQKVTSLPMLTQAEEHQLLVEFNDTAAAYPKNKTIVDLFEEQAAKTPENIAVVYEDIQLTYQQLNERSNQLAHYLRSKGVQAETLVPVCIERSAELIVGILGILKAGGAYVPIDPEYPAKRIQYMLEDTVAKLVVTSTQSSPGLQHEEGIDRIEIDAEEAISNHFTDNLQASVKPDNLAYIIYTSGSTGQPKGVMVEHRNVVSLVKNVSYVSLTVEDILLSTGSPSFDATTFEYWGMLLNGGQLILCRESKLLDSDFLKAEIRNRKVNKMWFTSSWFNYLADKETDLFENLQTILVGGEKLSEPHIEKIRNKYPSLELINGYGPTENTTFSLTYPILETEINGSIPIGHPLSNRNAYIVDEDGNLVPVGVRGEIYLGGAGLSRGYLNRADLSNEKFVEITFNQKESLRLYKTGDLGKWLPGGMIEYFGRTDDQVKIRGYRIELGEIESLVLLSGLVNQAVVAVSIEKESSSKRLVGYIVTSENFNQDELSAYLRGKLPDYMIPASWVVMDEFPLNKNGKVDKHRLLQVEPNNFESKEYVPPSSLLQKELCRIWQNILGIEKVGVNDNFFELGGDSIFTIQVVSQVKRLGLEIEPMDLFINQTIKSLSTVLEERSSRPIQNDSAIEELTSSASLNGNSYEFKFLVPIKTGGKKVPLYIVSGGGGTVFKFKKMVDLLDTDQSVYGLQQPTNQKDLEKFPDTIEAIASAYISEILIQNPLGPYAISGHCAGGIIAYEMCKQLEEMGKKVVFLAMFDTIAPSVKAEIVKPKKGLDKISALLKRSFLKAYLKVDFETFLLRTHTKHAVEYKINSLKSLVRNVAPSPEEDEVFMLYKRLEDSFRSAQKRYNTMPYDGNIVIYYAKYNYYFFDSSRNVKYRKFTLSDSIKNRWNQYATSVEIYEIEGEHSTMFDPEVGGKELAGLLQSQLDDCNKKV